MENPLHVSGPSPFKIGDKSLKVGDKALRLTTVTMKPPKQRLMSGADHLLKTKRNGKGDAVINRYASIKLDDKPMRLDRPRKSVFGRRKSARTLM